MATVSEAFDLARVGKRDLAASILKQEFQKLQSTDQKVELCEWIASCFESLNDFSQAGEWYEMAGVLSLSHTSSPLLNAMMAIREYERAIDCYEMRLSDEEDGNEENMQDCLEIIRELRRAYSAS